MDSARYKILLIEDNKLDQMAFRRFVDGNAIPYDCTMVGSVAESKDVLTALDVLQSAGSTPVIVVTGAGDEETAVKTWKAGAYDYLVKDIDQSYLRAIPITVENAITHKMMEE
ncbi:MAG: response regulator, partial [Planctomycetota bacterium]